MPVRKIHEILNLFVIFSGFILYDFIIPKIEEKIS
jgi:hypothetical protein